MWKRERVIVKTIGIEGERKGDFRYFIHFYLGLHDVDNLNNNVMIILCKCWVRYLKPYC